MFGNVKKSWKTTFAGVLTLVTTGWQIYTTPATLADPSTMAQILAGIGLIVAKDASKTGTELDPRGLQK